jgi:hypothetical protein
MQAVDAPDHLGNGASRAKGASLHSWRSARISMRRTWRRLRERWIDEVL